MLPLSTSQLAQELFRCNDSNSQFLGATEISDVVRQNRITFRGHGHFEYEIVACITQKRSPQEEYLLGDRDVTYAVDETNSILRGCVQFIGMP